MARTVAVFFDVDFTLIRPGPRFQGIGYEATCLRHGIPVDRTRFDAAVAGAASILTAAAETYDPELYVRYTRRIIELMGGEGPHVDAAARELYAEWAEHQHFDLYDDAAGALRALRAMDVRIGLISNSHRHLASFQSHFELDGLIEVSVSSSEHGFMKPHPRIFEAALTMMDVPARSAAMVGDSMAHDVAGARRAGMRGILLLRGARDEPAPPDVEVIRSLDELPALLAHAAPERS